MKLKKWFVLGLAGVICTMFLTGCSTNTPLPKGMDEDKLIAAGAEVRDMIFAGEYEKIAGMFREDVRTEFSITAEKLRILAETYANPKDIGTFKKINKTSVSGNNEGEDHGIVVFECEFSEKKVGVAVSFDMDMNLMGITLGRE